MPTGKLILAQLILTLVSPILACCATDAIPSNLVGAWTIEKAVAIDSTAEGEDEAARGNLLLLLGGKILLAADRNSANDRDFAETPLVIDMGFEIIGSEQKASQTYALSVRGKEKPRIKITEREVDSMRTLLVEILIRDDLQTKLRMELSEIDPVEARGRVSKLLGSARFERDHEPMEGTELTGTKDLILKWLANQEIHRSSVGGSTLHKQSTDGTR